MGCCNQKRAAMIAPASPPADRAQTPAQRVTVRYTASRPIRVRGTATGRVYHCSARSPVLAVDARDAAALIRTGLFRR
jgi:hypothetical protein